MEKRNTDNIIYIGNLSPYWADENVLSIFEGVEGIEGIVSFQRSVDKHGAKRTYGFIEFANSEFANLAIAKCDGITYRNRPIK